MKMLILSLAILAGCSAKTINAQKVDLLYIHGSHFDGSSWDEVRKITNVKIPSMAPSTGKRGLQEAAQFYCDQIPQKAFVIAHSYGGSIANQMTAFCADKIAEIIYIAAVSPHNNEMSFDLLSQKDQDSYSSAVDFGETMISPKNKKKFLEVMSSEKNVNKNVVIHSEPITLGSEKLSLNESVFKKIKKSYIFTMRDSIIGIASQKKYAERDNVIRSRSIDSGHLPMVTNAKELADIILDLVESWSN